MSRFGLLRILCVARGDAGFQLLRSFGQFFGNFPKELGRAPFGFRRDFLFQVLAEASQLFVKSAS